MRQARQIALDFPVQPQVEAALDLVIPFTTPALTLTALHAANKLGLGLNASVRLLKIQVVPFPLDLAQSPVPVEFLKEQLSSLQSDLPISREVVLAREFEPGLTGTLSENTLVVLATNKRPWRTRTERMAASLRRAGYTVVLVRGGNNTNA